MSEKKAVQHVWNTGRFYQEYGQVIAADIRELAHTVYTVHFRDISRMIDGQFSMPAEAGEKIMTEGPLALEEVVMFYYDRNYYLSWWSAQINQFEKLYGQLGELANSYIEKIRSKK